MRLRNALNEIRQCLCGKINAKAWVYLYLAGVWVATYVFLNAANAGAHAIRPSFSDPQLSRILMISDIGVMLLFLIVFVRNIPVKRFWLRAGAALLALLFLIWLMPTI